MDKKKNLVVFCAHPDDEVIGCGGSILYYKKKLGYKVNVVFFTDGETSRNFKSPTKKKIKIGQRRLSSKNAAKILKIDNIHQLNYSDNELDKYTNLVLTREVENILSKYQPDTIFTHSDKDLNIDHQLVNRAVQTAARSSGKNFIKNIFAFEISSSTNSLKGKDNFNPNMYIDISIFIEQKKKALNQYSNQFKKYPNQLSIKSIINLNKCRGSEMCRKFCEAFEVLRILK